MEDRRKIIIPVGAEPETPHFDAEETLLSARPVVPITPGEIREDFHRAPSSRPSAPFYRRSAFLTLIVLAAVGMGLAAGLGIARYRYQAAPVVAQPAPQAAPASDTRTATVQTPKDNEQPQHPALPEVKVEEQTTVSDTAGENGDKRDESETPSKASARAPESSKEKSSGDDEDKARTDNSAPRDKKRTNDDDEDADNAPRAQRRDRRVRRDEDTGDIPRRIERASEQINRIREIFEGRQRP